MLKALNELFDRAFAAKDAEPENREHALRIATALLLIEVARADFVDDLDEGVAIVAQLKEFFGLEQAEAKLLVEEARRQADHAVSLQSFTRRLVEALTEAEKHRVVEMLWRVALADSRLDKHEDYVVRQVAELLYVPQRDLIKIRNRVYEPKL
jgi:uncharacterized tellurite resistance protein B-like protein